MSIEIKKLRPYLYLLDDNHEATGYLVIGKEKACLIDTMNGSEDLSEIVKSLTDKPVMVVNTHGHPDHIYGNIYFEKAYMNYKDFELAKSFINDQKFIEYCKEKNKKMPPFENIMPGDEIDLGGKKLIVYALPGHTEGSIVLLLKEDRILFTGDSINHHLWMQLPHSLDMRIFRGFLSKLLVLEEEADMILHGHARDYDDISLMRALYNGVVELLEGEFEHDLPYKWFGGEDYMHPFKVDPEKKYQQDDHVICYSKSFREEFEQQYPQLEGVVPATAEKVSFMNADNSMMSTMECRQNNALASGKIRFCRECGVMVSNESQKFCVACGSIIG